MSMKLAYQQLVETKKLSYDEAQLLAVNALNELSYQLSLTVCDNSSFFSKVLSLKLTSLFNQNRYIKGIYFYGKVGRGKTMLMDLFYQHLAIEKKMRIHFHRFMESVHQQLNEISTQHALQQTKQTHSLSTIAKRWATKVDVLCFDEFFVSDIGDAMLMSGLLDALFAQGITLVATSNCQPENLYKNGLQRALFLPTIELINDHCQVISIDGEIDHRRSLSDNNCSSLAPKVTDTKIPYHDYVYPNTAYPNFLRQRFTEITQENKLTSGRICINHRNIDYVAMHDKTIYFDFFALCSGPRSQRDYIILADMFDTILIDNVPQFHGDLIPAVFSGVEDSYQRSGVLMSELRHFDDEARRFIALVDEFYDQNIRLIISAEVDIDALYQATQLAFEFERCQSRLFEMQKIYY